MGQLVKEVIARLKIWIWEVQEIKTSIKSRNLANFQP